ncbi:hypothetical protein DH2020_010175 [Rehmannia glutinosa]|uniref:Enoyl reductase (ER) domain-containing protein n=1 Tax=Rehmannia glutinosa TaxID=99300 RepID=A0ABR0X8E5_REHGL
MVLPKITNFHHHHRFLQNSFSWGSSSLSQLQRALTKSIPSALGVQNKAAIGPLCSSAVVESKMVKAIRVHELGGPEVLKWEDVEIGEPKDGEIKVKNKAIGLNFIDVYFRKGCYIVPNHVFECMEAVGVVTAVGPGLTGRKVGDLVAYAGNPMGAYAEEQILPAEKVVPVPPSIDPIIAASVMLKGMTAQFLVRQCFKVAQAKDDGCHHVILYKEEDFVTRVNEITSGKGVEVVYDSVGKDTFEGSLACLKLRGYMVNFGQSSGTPDPGLVVSSCSEISVLDEADPDALHCD